MNSYCFIVPVFNHHHKLEKLIGELSKYKYPIFLIDDGSHEQCKTVMTELCKANEKLILHTLDHNQGKGAAVMAGFIQAEKLKISHAIQIDADFQHDINDVEIFVEQAQKNPDALIYGIPVYDESVPKSRLYSRYLTHVWVWINTLSTDIKDSMCGYRLYPLNSTMKLIKSVNIGKRMNFDIEIIVRLKWRNIQLINIPTKVIYHDDVPSNFRLFKDNVEISKTHAKLFFGMLVRFPLILKRKVFG